MNLSEQERPSVNWPTFLRPHDLCFDTLPQGWQEAPTFGNAMVGSMLYQQEGCLCLEIFRADVQDHRDESYGWTAYSRPHFRLGHFTLRTVGKLLGCHWRQDLWHAELTGTLTTDQGEIGLRHFVHAEDLAIVTELCPTAGEQGCAWTWHPLEAKTSRDGYPTNAEERTAFAKRYGRHYLEPLQPWTPNPAGRLETRGNVSVWIQDLLAGGQYATAWTEHGCGRSSAGGVMADGTRTHIATIANSYPAVSAAETAVAEMVRIRPAQGLDAWVATHRAWWHKYYAQSFVALPDKSLEGLYWQTIYRLGCTSRAGRFYIDTCGLWAQGGSWPYSTHDWNTQAAHWGVYAANRLEQGAEIVHRLHQYRENLIAAVYPEAWRTDSAYLPLATAGDLIGSRISDMRYYDCVGCLPWLLHNAWWQYRYSMDDEMLREQIFPLLRRAINLYLHLMHTGADGRLHLAPTYSPETEVCGDANFDLALFKWGCHALLHACRRLKIEDPLMPRWREVVEKLVDFPVDEQGFMLGAGRRPWAHHRHMSHLLMIYPLYLVNAEQAGMAEVLKRSCAQAHGSAGSDGSATLGNLHAMVQTHAGPLAAALGEGDMVLEGLQRLQRELHSNGLWSCSGNPCFESSVSLINNIQEMLIQSWSDPALAEPGAIRIFPALPSSWQEVEFHDLRAEGAFLVSSRRSGGRTMWIRIRSLAGEPCRVRPGLSGEIRVEGQRPHRMVQVVPGVYEIDLQKGEEVLLGI